MPDYWMDADSFIVPYRGPYRFNALPQFWVFLEEKAREEVIASPDIVLEKELLGAGKPDELGKWAKTLKGVMFVDASEAVQRSCAEIAQYVEGHPLYKAHWIAAFLDGADPWVIAHALSQGGRIVTFETPQPEARKPKIPDVANHFGIQCTNLWDMLAELKWRA